MEISHYKTIGLIVFITVLAMATALSHKNMSKLESEKIIIQEKVIKTKEELNKVRQENIGLKDSLEQKTKEYEKTQTKLNKTSKKLKEKQRLPQTTRGGLRLGNRSVPSGDTSMKSYMSYTTITSKSSQQYKLQHSGKVRTDNNGFRRIDDMYCIAVGTYYAESIGTILEIELDGGNTFKAVVGDFKANVHTDSNNQQHAQDGSVIEFIVNRHTLVKNVRRSGNCSNLKGMEGNIKSIKVAGKIDF